MPPARPSRRRVLAGGALTLLMAADAPAAAPADLPVSGPDVPELAAFDRHVRAYMAEHAIPGGAVAVARAGRLVYARGFGLLDTETRAPAQPTSRFRIASVSKPITGMALAALLHDGRAGLTPDTPVVAYLGIEPYVKRGREPDARIRQITIRHLLNHSAGWDRSLSGDLMFKHFEVARDLRIPSPPDHAALIRWGLGQALDHDPGQKYAYSNFGYCILGRVIEKAAGRPYETFVRERFLAPLGITGMRIGKGRRSERLPDEAVYYQPAGGTVRNVFSTDAEKRVPAPYGFASPETMDAHGGWIASAVDLVRLGAALDHPPGRPLLTPAARSAMLARPPAPLGREGDGTEAPSYYAYGWHVRPTGGPGRLNHWHAGGMPGTSSILVRLATGTVWAAVFNTRPAEANLDGMLHAAAQEVRRWPTHDLFPRFYAG